MEEKKLFRFLDWPVYNDAQKFFQEILNIAKKLPSEIRYSLGDQITRSSLSIILNIAEGSGRGTDKDFNRFFNIAVGSIHETVAGVDALSRGGYISKQAADKLFDDLVNISRQCGGFKKKLNSF